MRCLLSLFVLLIAFIPLARAGADNQCNGDVVLARCSGNDKYNTIGAHMLTSGTGPAWGRGTDSCAAMVWVTGRLSPEILDDLTKTKAATDDSDLYDVKRRAEIVLPSGVELPNTYP